MHQIIDAGGSGTSSTGAWSPYGSSAQALNDDLYYDNNSDGNTYTWTFTERHEAYATCKVYMSWHPHPNRATNVTVKIYDDTTLLDTVSVNQQASATDFYYNPGSGNTGFKLLGTYSDVAKPKVVMDSTGANGYCIADGVIVTNTTLMIDAIDSVCVNAAGAAYATASSCTLTFDSTIGSPNLMVVTCASYANYGSFSDSLNTWTLIGNAGAAGDGCIRMYYVVNPTTNASHALVYSASNVYPGMSVICFDWDMDSVDDSSFDTDNTPGSITPASSNSLAVSGYTDGITSANPVADVLDSNVIHSAYVGSGKMGSTLAKKLIASGAVNPTWTNYSYNASGLVIFAPAGAGGGGAVPRIINGGLINGGLINRGLIS